MLTYESDSAAADDQGHDQDCPSSRIYAGQSLGAQDRRSSKRSADREFFVQWVLATGAATIFWGLLLFVAVVLLRG